VQRGSFFLSAIDTQISVKERVTKGKNHCIEGSVVNLTRNVADGTLQYNARAAGRMATAVLTKVGH
jgi:hypothetical protein